MIRLTVMMAMFAGCGHSATAPAPPDAAVADLAIIDEVTDGRPLTCNQLDGCIGDCGGNHDCEQNCLFAASTRARVLRTELLQCLDKACPHDVSSDPCQVNNPLFPGSCDQCKERVVMDRQPCSSALSNCIND